MVGLSNRTLPQNITPIPSSLVTTPSQPQRVSAKPAEPSKFPADEIEKDAVVVSLQNPYLNIQLGPIDQRKRDPKSGVQSDILKAMDDCVRETHGGRNMLQISGQTTHRAVVAHAQRSIDHGSSGSLLHGRDKLLTGLLPVETSIDSRNKFPTLSKMQSSADFEMQTGTKDDENSKKQSSDLEQELCKTPSAICISEVTVNSSADREPIHSNTVLPVDRNVSHTDSLECSSSPVGIDTSGNTAETMNDALTLKQVEQICKPKLTADSNNGEIHGKEQPDTFAISPSQQDRITTDSAAADLSQNLHLQSSRKPNTINLWSKSKKKDDAASTSTPSPKSGKETKETPSTNAGPSDNVTSGQSTSKSVDGLSDDMYTDDILPDCDKIKVASVKELKVVLHDINDVDSEVEPDIKSAAKDKEGRTKNISEDLLQRKDELFSDCVRNSDSSSIDSNSIPDPDARSRCSDRKRRISHSRKKRLRDFARNDKPVDGGDFKLVTRSRKLSSSTTSGKVLVHDSTSANCKEDADEVCNGMLDEHTSRPVLSVSDDSPVKLTKRLNQENERRYPRRNPFTCLRSFSGLSPNYAIQSYSLKSPDKQDRVHSQPSKFMLNRKNPKSVIKKLIPKRTIPECQISADDCQDTAIYRGRSPMSARKTRLGRTRAQSLDFSQKICCAEESPRKLDEIAEDKTEKRSLSCDIAPLCQGDSTVNEAVRQLYDSSSNDERAVQT